MPWGRMDDKFHRNAKVRSLRRLRGGRDALGAWVFWWSWCLDDPDLTGFVPSDELPSADEKAAELLVQVGLWDEVEGGYRFHDFDKYNPTREQLDAKRKADRERVAAKREATRENVASDTAAIPARVASTRDPIPSHPNPNPTEREGAREILSDDSAPELPPDSIAAAVVQRWGDLATGSRFAQAASDFLHDQLGTPRWDPVKWLQDLAWIAQQPMREVSGVVSYVRAVPADDWLRRPGNASPGHLRKHWPKYAAGPAEERREEPQPKRTVIVAPADYRSPGASS